MGSLPGEGRLVEGSQLQSPGGGSPLEGGSQVELGSQSGAAEGRWPGFRQ